MFGTNGKVEQFLMLLSFLANKEIMAASDHWSEGGHPFIMRTEFECSLWFEIKKGKEGSELFPFSIPSLKGEEEKEKEANSCCVVVYLYHDRHEE